MIELLYRFVLVSMVIWLVMGSTICFMKAKETGND